MPSFVKLPFAVASAFFLLSGTSQAGCEVSAPCSGYGNSVILSNLEITAFTTDPATCHAVFIEDWGSGSCASMTPPLITVLRTWPNAMTLTILGLSASLAGGGGT